MAYRIQFIWFILLLTVLTGCWDQRLLRDHSLILSTGYDKLPDEKIMNTVVYPRKSEQKDTFPQKSIVVSTIGDTARDAKVHMDQRIAEKFDSSKSNVILLGEELAAGGVFPVLDSIYRDLRGPLNARVAIIKGNAKDALSLHTEDGPLTSVYYSELLQSAEQAGLIKNDNVQFICPIILSEGKDIMVPYLSLITEENRAHVDGLAMFNEDKYSGSLGMKESSMFLILHDQITKKLSLNLKVNDDRKPNEKNYINIDVLHNKRKLKVKVVNGEIRAEIHLDLKLGVKEYPADHLYRKKEVERLNKKIQVELQELAQTTLTKMQDANCDALGIGDKVKAFHNQKWKSIDWDKTYPEIPIETYFKVDIIQYGIIN